jgi:hypothetical protein
LDKFNLSSVILRGSVQIHWPNNLLNEGDLTS